MINIKIHRGTHQIGGCATEIECNGTRILIDLGANLPGTDSATSITDKQLVRKVFGKDKKRKFDAVLFSHYHGDHYGLYREIPSGIDMYIGATAKDILKVVVSYISNESRAIVDGMKVYERVDAQQNGAIVYEREASKPIRFKPVIDNENMRITPYRVDHSALDAYMFLIEAEGKRILFTGDFRDHGIVNNDGSFWDTIDEIGKVDLLITEGTMLSRGIEVKKNIVKTEEALGIKAGEYFSEKPYNFVVVSSTNLDSVMEFYHNTPEDMAFVCDAYQAKVIAVAMAHNHLDYEKYQGKLEGDTTKKIFYIGDISDSSKKMLKAISAKVKREGGRQIDFEEYQECEKNGFAMLIRPNHFPQYGASIFEKTIDKYRELSPEKANIVYSMWGGYLEGKHKDNDLVRLIGDGIEVKHLHTSGHAYIETIAELMRRVMPEVVVPMHTEMAREFRDLEEFKDFKNNIRELHDSELLRIVGGRVEPPKYEFRRKNEYSTEFKREIKELWEKYDDILLMPNSNCFIGYCKGIVLLSRVSENCFNIVSRGYDLAGDDSEQSGVTLLQRDATALALRRKENLKRFKQENFVKNKVLEYTSCMSYDKERRSSQIIAHNNMTFKDDVYSVCGWETTISLHDVYDIGKNGAPEIDIVVANPKEKQLVLVEYKCVGASMLANKKGIGEHYSDYRAVMKSDAFDHIKKELLKTYALMYEIKNGIQFLYNPDEWKVELGFLFVDKINIDGRKAEITKDDYETALTKKEFANVWKDEELLYIRAESVDTVDFSTWTRAKGSGLKITSR